MGRKGSWLKISQLKTFQPHSTFVHCPLYRMYQYCYIPPHRKRPSKTPRQRRPPAPAARPGSPRRCLAASRVRPAGRGSCRDGRDPLALGQLGDRPANSSPTPASAFQRNAPRCGSALTSELSCPASAAQRLPAACISLRPSSPFTEARYGTLQVTRGVAPARRRRWTPAAGGVRFSPAPYGHRAGSADCAVGGRAQSAFPQPFRPMGVRRPEPLPPRWPGDVRLLFLTPAGRLWSVSGRAGPPGSGHHFGRTLFDPPGSA